MVNIIAGFFVLFFLFALYSLVPMVLGTGLLTVGYFLLKRIKSRQYRLVIPLIVIFAGYLVLYQSERTSLFILSLIFAGSMAVLLPPFLFPSPRDSESRFVPILVNFILVSIFTNILVYLFITSTLYWDPEFTSHNLLSTAKIYFGITVLDIIFASLVYRLIMSPMMPAPEGTDEGSRTHIHQPEETLKNTLDAPGPREQKDSRRSLIIILVAVVSVVLVIAILLIGLLFIGYFQQNSGGNVEITQPDDGTILVISRSPDFQFTDVIVTVTDNLGIDQTKTANRPFNYGDSLSFGGNYSERNHVVVTGYSPGISGPDKYFPIRNTYV